MVGASVTVESTTPDPSLRRRGIAFMHGGEPKDHDVFARNDSVHKCEQSATFGRPQPCDL